MVIISPCGNGRRSTGLEPSGERGAAAVQGMDEHRIHIYTRVPVQDRLGTEREDRVTPLKIVYAFDNRVPSPQADTEQLLSTVAALSRRNLEISLLVPRLGPEATGTEMAGYYGVRGSFPVHRFRMPRHPRVAQKLWAALRVPVADVLAGADLLYTRNLPIAMGAAARGRRVVLDTYRPWPRQVPLLRPAVRWLMRSRGFVGAVLHSKLARNAYLNAGVPEERLLVAHNGYEPARMEPVLDRDEAREALGLDPARPTVVYTGRIGGDKGLDVVLGTARRCPEALFLMVGSTREDPFERAARSLPNVELVPWQSFDDLSTWLYAADVLLVPPSEDPLERRGHTVLPMKLFVYLAAGRAILAGSTPDIRELLVDGKNASLVPVDEPDAAARAVRRLLDDDAFRARLARGATETARDLTWDARARKIHEFLLRRAVSLSISPPPSRPPQPSAPR